MTARIDVAGWLIPSVLLACTLPVALGAGAPEHVGPAAAVATLAVLLLLMSRRSG